MDLNGKATWYHSPKENVTREKAAFRTFLINADERTFGDSVREEIEIFVIYYSSIYIRIEYFLCLRRRKIVKPGVTCSVNDSLVAEVFSLIICDYIEESVAGSTETTKLLFSIARKYSLVYEENVAVRLLCSILRDFSSVQFKL